MSDSSAASALLDSNDCKASRADTAATGLGEAHIDRQKPASSIQTGTS